MGATAKAHGRGSSRTAQMRRTRSSTENPMRNAGQSTIVNTPFVGSPLVIGEQSSTENAQIEQHSGKPVGNTFLKVADVNEDSHNVNYTNKHSGMEGNRH